MIKYFCLVKTIRMTKIRKNNKKWKNWINNLKSILKQQSELPIVLGSKKKLAQMLPEDAWLEWGNLFLRTILKGRCFELKLWNSIYLDKSKLKRLN